MLSSYLLLGLLLLWRTGRDAPVTSWASGFLHLTIAGMIRSPLPGVPRGRVL